ncbi:transcriptional regulator NrdR [Cellulomonas sp. PSBB021]|nr:transcriptional regulator NrdR [Cellulomonas sp. PSBB021]ASR54316.1 transcriptional regulator NrdR [Cellulomonas sp. PSBB021]
MHCPFCRHPDSRVVDSRTSDDGASIRRRRQCPSCNRRFTTVETTSLSVVKRSGATEPFSRDKIAGGVRKACQGRPVSEDDLALLAQKVEETLRSSGSAEIDAYEIGLAILGPLRELDEVAYLRFASVYQAFDSLEDFEAAITVLRAERDDRDRGARDEAPDAAAPGVATPDTAAADTAVADTTEAGTEAPDAAVADSGAQPAGSAPGAGGAG